MKTIDPDAWACLAAATILRKFSSSASVDTGDYRECGFILSAARLAIEDPDVAYRLGSMMESQRDDESETLGWRPK